MLLRLTICFELIPNVYDHMTWTLITGHINPSCYLRTYFWCWLYRFLLTYINISQSL